MHFLIDASLPRSAAILLRQLGHDATDVRDAGMGDAPDDGIAEYARRNRLILITRDLDLRISATTLRPSTRESLCSNFAKTLLRRVLETFVSRGDWLAHLNGRLAILEDWRVRFRAA
jgi:predicted nuclease of predicted toxin-antitoxin system